MLSATYNFGFVLKLVIYLIVFSIKHNAYILIKNTWQFHLEVKVENNLFAVYFSIGFLYASRCREEDCIAVV